MKNLSFKCSFSLIVLLWITQSYAAQYTVQPIGTLGGTSTVVARINNVDQVLVESQLPSGEYHIAILENGVLTDLGLVVPNIDGYDSGYIYGFNDLGHVAGMTTSLNQNSIDYFYYDGNSVVNLSEIINYAIPPALDNGITGLNNNGVMTATRQGSIYKEAIILNPDGNGAYTMDTFGFPGKHNWALGLNDSNRVHGLAREDLVSPNISKAVIYDNGNLYEIGTLGGTDSHPYDMNEQGEVVGVSQDSAGNFKAYSYSNNIMRQLDDLGGFWSSAFGMNDNGEIVGGSYNPSYQLHAFINKNGVTTDLNDLIDPASGWTLTYGWDINNNGLIVGVGTINGESKPFLLTPVNEPPVVNIGGPYTGIATLAVQFDGSASMDPEGKPLTYQWDFGDGSAGSGSNPVHTYANSGVYTVTLIVSDGVLNSELGSTSVTIDNHAPVADAGADFSALVRSTVVLDATASYDPDGQIESYQWLQTVGRSVSLSDPTSPVPSFRAPRVRKPEILVFELTIVDNEGGSTTDSVSVTVFPK